MQCCVPSFTYSRRRKCQTSVVRAHGGLAPAARQALLDGHGGRNAIHGIHLGPARGLDDGSGRRRSSDFEVAALAFVEQDVKRQRGFARAAHAGDDVELAARNVHAQVLEVVLVGVDDFDGIAVRSMGCFFGRGA